MGNQILVVYASKYGATAEIAEKIGETLYQEQLDVQVLPVEREIDLSAYQTVILGSPIYVGRWRPEIVNFLEANEDQLTARNIWIFSSGPTGVGAPEDLLNGWFFPRTETPLLDRIVTRDVKLFHGAIDVEKLDFLERNTIRELKADVGDYRDWKMIVAWAKEIAVTLKNEAMERK